MHGLVARWWLWTARPGFSAACMSSATRPQPTLSRLADPFVGTAAQPAFTDSVREHGGLGEPEPTPHIPDLES